VYVESDAQLEANDDLQLVFAPAYEFADPARWQHLLRFAKRGGAVFWGPQLPSLDGRMEPHVFERPSARAALKLRDQAEADACVRALVRELDLQPPILVSPAAVQATIHEDEHGPRALFLVNPSALDLQAQLRLHAPARLRDALSAERFERAVSFSLPVPAQSCRMLIVETDRHDQ
jgi:hypothetical protein